MTLREMMKKVDTYNEIAELMGTQKAAISFVDSRRSEKFVTYSDLWRYIRREYIKEVADLILKDDTWGIDELTTIVWRDAFDKQHLNQFYTGLVTD